MAKFLLIFMMFMLCHVDVDGFDFIVSANGSGNFTSIQQAVDNAPIYSRIRFEIKVNRGTYGFFTVPIEKAMISIIGDGSDVTISTGSRSNKTGYPTSDTATAQIFGPDFVARDIAFRNTAGPGMGQAVALMVNAHRAAFYRCKIDAYQDSLYVANYEQFYRECQIYGTVDFIFGDANVVLQNCDIYLHQPSMGQKNVITAQDRNMKNKVSAIVLHNCTISAAQDFDVSSGVKTYLGRPWGNYAATVVMESYLPDFIDPQGWLEWNNNTRYKLDQLYYREYNNRGPGAKTDLRVKWNGYRVITNVSEAENFTVKKFINGKEWLPSTKIPFYPDLIRARSETVDVAITWRIIGCLIIYLFTVF